MALCKVKLTSDNRDYYTVKVLDATAVAMAVFTVMIVAGLPWYLVTGATAALVVTGPAVAGFLLSLLIGATSRYLERSVSRAYGALHAVASEPQCQDTD